jgi:hypothetical protein
VIPTKFLWNSLNPNGALMDGIVWRVGNGKTIPLSGAHWATRSEGGFSN